MDKDRERANETELDTLLTQLGGFVRDLIGQSDLPDVDRHKMTKSWDMLLLAIGGLRETGRLVEIMTSSFWTLYIKKAGDSWRACLLQEDLHTYGASVSTPTYQPAVATLAKSVGRTIA